MGNESTGFGKSTLTFLAELAENNSREWFQANKARYESEVVDPAMAFIAAMNTRLPKISKYFLAIPKKSGGSMMRIYRDTRFSKDKTPYKTNLGIQFRHSIGKDVHAPGYYLHIEPTEVFIGVGLWRPDKDALEGIRQRIVNKPNEWLAARDDKAFAKAYEIVGDSLQRPPRGYDPDHPMLEDLKRKDHIAVLSLKPSVLARKDFADTFIDLAAQATPYMKFLCKAVDVQF